MVRRIVSVVILAAAPLTALATDPLSYSFVEGQYLNSKFKPEVDGTKGEQDEFEGWRAAVSVSLHQGLFFTGEADDRRPTGYRYGTQSAGLGWHTGASTMKNAQIFAAATYERAMTNYLGTAIEDHRDEGYGVQAGLRVPYDAFEFSADYRYLDYGKSDDVKLTGGRYGAAVAVQLWPYFALTGDYRHLGLDAKASAPASGTSKRDFDEWTVGFRAYFATDIDRYRRRGGLFSSGE